MSKLTSIFGNMGLATKLSAATVATLIILLSLSANMTLSLQNEALTWSTFLIQPS